MKTLDRRDFLRGGVTASVVPGFSSWLIDRRRPRQERPGRSPVVVAKASRYDADLAGILRSGIRECGLQVKGQRILLKPNLVEFDRVAPINTHVAVVAAAVEVFEGMGAAQVLIGEGPGHRRDAYYLAEEAGYKQIPNFEKRFVDLNLDDVTPVPGFVRAQEIYLPNTALTADLVVSVAKMKTHHWVGATLTMKNLFGLVPGSVYGWPKNHLHQQGIPSSIVGLNRIFRRTFCIVDGIVGMEGNGPIQGVARAANVLVMGPDVVAVDATASRVMGLDPELIEYLDMSADLGHLTPGNIEQRGEEPSRVRTPFALLEEFRMLRLSDAPPVIPGKAWAELRGDSKGLR
ncbi:MAG: DUF362 domain-containing protein [Acidobacteria bacterium]|nr:DUF362 domain-containing protein [Acidobacteriota bacterium]